ncbi:MAG TPA: hypothetical protein VGR51_10030 [Thermoplasmata archaeon]|jgi:hypothetical protein|nr:hypothetical protein [Thermoplasmata archaeon]
MARNWDVLDLSVATAFAVGGAVNVLLGVGYTVYRSFLGILYFPFGLVCLWLAWGVWRGRYQAWSIGILVAVISLFPPIGPLPNLTVWILWFVGDPGAYIISAAVATLILMYFWSRRGRFEFDA